MENQIKADLSLLAITVVWGTSFPLMSVALKSVPPYTFISIRYLLASFILALIFIKKIKNINKATIIAGVVVGASLGVGSILQAVGLLYTTPSKSGFITGLNVILVPIFIAIIYKKMPNVKTNFGIILSIIGLAIMSLNGNVGVNKGDILTLIAAVSFAVQILLVDRFVSGIDIVLLTCIELLTVGALSTVPAALIEGFKMNLNIFAISAIAFTAIFCTIIAYGVQNIAQGYTTPTHAAIIFLAEPVFSAIFSVFIGDKLTGRTLIGCLFILTGMIIVNIKLEGKGETA